MINIRKRPATLLNTIRYSGISHQMEIAREAHEARRVTLCLAPLTASLTASSV